MFAIFFKRYFQFGTAVGRYVLWQIAQISDSEVSTGCDVQREQTVDVSDGSVGSAFLRDGGTDDRVAVGILDHTFHRFLALLLQLAVMRRVVARRCLAVCIRQDDVVAVDTIGYARTGEKLVEGFA